MNDDKKNLAEHFRRTDAFQRGKFVLASGKESDVYVDCRRITLDGKALEEISRQFLNLFNRLGLSPRCVGGITSGADPIVAGVILYSRMEYGRDLQGFYVKKDLKDHGLGGRLFGHCPVGSRVVIFDDTVTTGNSVQVAVDAARANGAQVLAVCAIVDRQEGAAEYFISNGIHFYSLITLKELDDYLQDAGGETSEG